MFNNISWANYGMFVVITLTVYYATIGALCYLNEIKHLFSRKSNLLFKLNPSKRIFDRNHLQPLNSINERDFAQKSKESLHPLAEGCMNDIKNLLQHAAKNNLIKQEIIYSLKQLVNNYPAIEDTSFKSFITNYILTECNNYCSIRLDEDELRLIWAK